MNTTNELSHEQMYFAIFFEKLRTLISAQSSSLLCVVVLNVGSFLTSFHTIDSISAMTFPISLWQSVANPSVFHVNMVDVAFCFADTFVW